MTKTGKNHYAEFKEFLPTHYRKRIADETKASVSLINKVIRGKSRDNKGILASFYRIVNEQIDLLEKNETELLILKEKIQKMTAA
jgi:hypothetical protein